MRTGKGISGEADEDSRHCRGGWWWGCWCWREGISPRTICQVCFSRLTGLTWWRGRVRVVCLALSLCVRVCVCFRQLGLDLVPRQEFSMVDPDEISVTELYRLVSVLYVLPRGAPLQRLLPRAQGRARRDGLSSRTRAHALLRWVLA